MIAKRLSILILLGLAPGLLGEGIFVLGFVHGFHDFQSVSPWFGVILGCIAALALAVLFQEVHEGTAALRNERGWERPVFWGSLVASLLILAAGGVLALLPPTHRDALIQHLALPKLYLQREGIVPFPFIRASYYPMSVDMLFLIPLSLGWDSGSHLISLFFGLMTCGLLFSFVKMESEAATGMVAATFFLLTPVVLPLLSSAYVDLALSFYTTGGLIALLLFTRTLRTRWLILAGLSVGLGMATKYLGVLVFVALCLVLSFSLSRQRVPARTIVRAVCAFGCIAVGPFLPWALRNLLWTGNPGYPLSGLFPGELSLSPLLMRVPLYGENWLQLALLPLRIFFFGQDGDPRKFDGVLGPGLLLFTLALALDRRKTGFSLPGAFCALFVVLNVLLLPARARYFLPMVPAASILASAGFSSLLLSARYRSVAIAGFAGCLLFFGHHAWAYIEKASPFQYFLGGQNREAFLRGHLPEYSAISFVNRVLPRDARVYLLLAGDRGYYLDRDYTYDPGQSARRLVAVIRQARHAGEIAEWLQRERISHLLCHDRLLARYLNDNLSAAEIARWARTRDGFPRLFRQNGFTVYEVAANG